MSNCFHDVIWKWTIRFIAVRPQLILFTTSLICVICLTVSCLYSLPSFSDPNLGFETRGTELSNRLISFENLVDQIRNPTRGTKDNPVLSKMTDRDRIVRSAHNLNRSSIKFCLEPTSEYSQIVLSGVDLWSPTSIKAMCVLESHFSSAKHYSDLCERRYSKGSKCCPMWSLPNYIAYLRNKTSCHHLTDDDITDIKNLVDECEEYFFFDGRTVPAYLPKKIPAKCRRKKALFNMVFFLLDHRYKKRSDKLSNVLVILPVARSSAVLPYYYSLNIQSLQLRNVSVSAINFGVKDALFNELLLQDSWLLAVGISLVSVCLYLYTNSVFLSSMTLLALVYSVILAYFFYTFVIRFTFFPFINLLSSVVAVGVGGDASLILIKTWWTKNHILTTRTVSSRDRSIPELWNPGEQSRPPENGDCSEQHPVDHRTSLKRRRNSEDLMELIQAVYRDSFLPLSLTSLTTATSFFATYTSSISSIACFGVFSGCVVLSNLLVTWCWMPSCLALQHRYNVFKYRERHHLGRVVLKPRLLWLSLFPIVTACACLVLVYSGGLPVPDRTSIQLLLSSHPVEKFHNVYSKYFWIYRSQMKSDVLALRWVWGIEALDSGDYLDPGSKGKLHFDNSFDYSHPDNQLFFFDFCKKIRRQGWYGEVAGVVGEKCFPEAVPGWLSRNCTLPSDPPCCGWPSTPPYPQDIYSFCSAIAASRFHGSKLAHPLAGPYFMHPDFNSTVRALVIEFLSNQTFTTSFQQMESFYKMVESWTREELSAVPSTVSKGWFISDLALYDIQSSLRVETVYSVLIAGLLVLLLVLTATRDFKLTIAAVVTVSGSTLTVAALLVLLGWHLDVLESSTASLSVGLAVDFTIHYALHYKSSGGGGACETLDAVGGPTLVCMITSCLAGAVMMPSQVLPYRRVAVFLLVLMPVSWVFSTLWFLSFLPTD